MTFDVIAILSPGDMGSGVGMTLGEHGHEVITCLTGRGEGSRMRAERAGMRDAGDLTETVAQADIVLSILPPEAAMETAHNVAAAMAAAGRTPPFADCNAVSPETTIAISDIIAAAGAPFIDGGVVGLAPGKGGLPVRFYVSGPNAGLMSELDGKGIDIRQCGDEVGRASAVKMCYAAVSKGTNTLYTAALMVAEVLGVSDIMQAEWEYSAPAVHKGMQTNVSRLPADAARWIREMEEIASTFESAGVTSHFHLGARDIYRLLATTPFASETRETIDTNRTLEETVAEFVRHLPMQEAAE